MTILAERQCVAKPFLKWAGGKTQLLDEIDRRLPDGLSGSEIETYIEPFVGGGAVFFYIAQKYESSVKHFYLFDINEDLVNCYNIIKNDIQSVIEQLQNLEQEFCSKRKQSTRKTFYLNIRCSFNGEKSRVFDASVAAKLIFLNKTCYNGLYRVNRKGKFNVPFGGYENPTVCDEDNLLGVSEILKKTKVICCDFENSSKYIDNKTFVYLDPPYRPLSPTASFTSYSKDNFIENDQIRLADFCKKIDAKSAKFLLSNSDPQNENPEDHFFEDNYSEFRIDRVKAVRAINCKASGRGQINELLITNY